VGWTQVRSDGSGGGPPARLSSGSSPGISTPSWPSQTPACGDGPPSRRHRGSVRPRSSR
jgi:hypothetical protein